MDNIDKNLLKEIVNLDNDFSGAYNIRKNGQGIERKVTENVNIVTKEDKQGIDVFVKEKYRGQGYGKAIVKKLLTLSPRKDVYLVSRDYNVKFYEKPEGQE